MTLPAFTERSSDRVAPAPRESLRMGSVFCAGWLALGVSLFAAEDPASELSTFTIAEGFEVNLFASEQEGVAKPIQIRFDPRGRLFVACSRIYPQIEPGQSADDKIFVLEDTNHDGRADKSTVFADGLFIPTGIEFGDGGLYVGAGTQLLHLKDTDGDGRADERRTVLRGFGTGDNHQNINSFLFGPGGELWMSQGLHIHSRVETPWGISRLDQAGIWRLWPRRLKLEGFYGSQHEPQNPWGFVFTQWGEPIVLAGNNSSPIYSAPGLVSHHRHDPPPLIWKGGNGRKVSGGDIVGTDHFPPEWQDRLIVGGYINNAVWALRIRDDGAGFVLEDVPPLVTSTGRSFRPVDVKFGPDGALYICDWYNPIIGHYQASFRHPDRDRSHGRIWRVTARGRPLSIPPRLAGIQVAELLDYLKSPDRWTRRFAKRELADRPTQEVTRALEAWIVHRDIPDHAMVEALGVYQSHESVSAELLKRLCRAADPAVRAYAAGVIGSWADRLSDPLPLLSRLVVDEHPRVRLQAIVACTWIPRAESMEIAAAAVDLAADRFLEYALNQAVFALKPQWLPALRAGRLNLENKPSRLALLVRADGTPDTLNALRELISSLSVGDPRREGFLGLLASVGEPDDLARLLDPRTFGSRGGHDASQQSRVLTVLAGSASARTTRPSGDPADALGALWRNSTNEALKVAVLQLATHWKAAALTPSALYAAACTPNNDELRIAGAVALATLAPEDGRRLLEELAVPGRAVGERVAAAVGLSTVDVRRAAAVAAEILAGDTTGGQVSNLLPTFLNRQGGSDALASEFAGKPPAKAAAENALRLINSSGRRDEKLASLLAQAAGWSRRLESLSAAEVGVLAAEVRARGDAARGAEVFRRPELGCVACHSVGRQGGTLGPNLSTLGTAQPIDFIIGAIVEPNKEVKEGYNTIEVTTRDGTIYQGQALRADARELRVRDSLMNREVRIRTDDIHERLDRGSIMPSGLVDHLRRDEFRDLVRYLSELGKPE